MSFLLALVLSLSTSALFAAQPGEFGDTVSDKGGVWLSILFYTLLIVLIGQGLAIIGRVLQVYELSADAVGTRKKVPWDGINGVLFLLFLIGGLYFTIWELDVHGSLTLPAAASEHGKNWDSMYITTFVITFIVFVITHILLLGFAFRYRQKKDRKAFFYPHNDRLEILWTSVPAVVLTLLVVFGWVNWDRITNPTKQAKDPIVVEVVGRQFNWLIRYPGGDGELGPRDYKLINSVNALGVDFTSQSSQDDIMPSELVLPAGKPVKMIFGA
ncbi:MAG TPA: cytochrome c oxidase subunit II transmembrane domain-containing protein, partial [Anseongella sp.]|nr:cytochrome c oxidase subunit II transmembrane domain-containing protein [Anseongella sp.]